MNIIDSYVKLIDEAILFASLVNNEVDANYNMRRAAQLICELREIEEGRDEG